MKIIERLGRTKVEGTTTILVLLAATIGIASFVLHRGFAAISSEASNNLMRVAAVIQLPVCGLLFIQWKQTKAQEKSRLKREAADAVRAETYVSEHMNDWK